MTLRLETSDVKIPNFDFNRYATMIHDTTDPYEQMSMNDPERMPDIFPLRGADVSCAANIRSRPGRFHHLLT